MKPKESRLFLIFLVLFAVLWAGTALFFWGGDPVRWRAFHRVFQIILVNLGLLIYLFWKLIFSKPERPSPLFKMQLFLAFTFKLVCLGFLAITLKELRNDPALPVFYGMLFIGSGPVLAAVSIRGLQALKEKRQG